MIKWYKNLSRMNALLLWNTLFMVMGVGAFLFAGPIYGLVFVAPYYYLAGMVRENDHVGSSLKEMAATHAATLDELDRGIVALEKAGWENLKCGATAVTKVINAMVAHVGEDAVKLGLSKAVGAGVIQLTPELVDHVDNLMNPDLPGLPQAPILKA